MVLEKLGSSLKTILTKITNANFVDKKLINELIKEIQKSLLQSDVNVQLVLGLTDKIKNRALNEEVPPGLTKKEHLVKVVYDELVAFVGKEEVKIEIKEKPARIMLVGLFGNGKCVHKDSNVLLWDGQTIGIEKLYNIYKEKDECVLEDGFVVPLQDELFVPSMNPDTLRVEKKRVSHLWKLKGKELYQIKLDNGNNFSVKTTPEHPFFVLNGCKVEQKRADELKPGQYVSVPSNYISEPRRYIFRDCLRQFDLDVYVSPEQVQDVKRQIIRQYGTLKNAVKHLLFKRNYCKFTQYLKQGQVPVYFYAGDSAQDRIKLKLNSAQDPVYFPTTLTPELAEFMGYVTGDGYLSKNSVSVSTADNEIIARFAELSKSLFSADISITKDKRSKAYHLRLNSCTITTLLSKLFGINIGRKGRYLEVPKIIQEASSDVVASYIRAYFDCDAYFSPKQRQIEVTSESQINIKQLQHMLLRFSILGVQIKKKIKATEYYYLLIQGRHVMQYANNIGSLLPRKKNALSKYELMTVKQGDGKQDMIPVGSLLKDLRDKGGYSINQIQSEVSSYGLYESKGRISKTQLKKVILFYEKQTNGNFAKLIDVINGKEVNELKHSLSQPLFNALVGEFKTKGMIAEVTNSPTRLLLTEKGKDYAANLGIDLSLLKVLRQLAYSDVSWIKVKEATAIKNDSDFVYDLSVEDNHNFIADGIIVHNTTTAGKLAKFYQKRGYKVAVMQTDTWRPAAYQQLEQLAKQINVQFFGIKGEKDPLKIYKTFEPKLAEYDIVIFDTAGRDALSEDLIEELNKLNKAIHADHRFLVIGADVGQSSQKQAQAFHDTCNVSGVIITKLDGTAKGGGAISACSVTKAPVVFIGVGEKIDDLEKFSPERFISRMLGMGDIELLLEKAKEAMTEEQAQDLGQKLLKGDFSLLDLYEQMSAMQKMGPLKKVIELIPGFGKMNIPSEMLDGQDANLKKWRHIMDSCTKSELEDPDVISQDRIERIAKGSGTSVSDVRQMLSMHKKSKKMVKMMKPGSKKMKQVMKQFGGNMPDMENIDPSMFKK
jgi:signal recognition particle subunit SRP54